MDGQTISQKYASFIPMTTIPYKIIETLALSESLIAENLWKLLKYTTTDTLSQSNLTFEEKMALVWTPDKMTSMTTQNDFNVFLKPLMPVSLNDDTSQTQLRIYRYKTTARSQYESIIMYEFDVIVNETKSMVYNELGELVEKTDLMEAYLIELLNMLDIGVGVNCLRFDRMQGGQCESLQNINNSKSLYGRSFLLALRYIDTSLGGGCSG
jgi:hypothetical protein